MLTLITTVVSFLTGGIPKIIEFFQDKSDKSHELTMMRAQSERELALAEKGFLAQARLEEVKLESTKIEGFYDERKALYAHDIALGQGASQWVINLRAMVRPAVTYGLFLLLVFVDVFGFWYAYHTGVQFDVALDYLWDDETQTIFASVISFWFGTQACAKRG